MSKKRFIQAVIARSLPRGEQRETALAYAENLWGWLSSKGYGDAATDPTPRESKDWEAELNRKQAHYFEQFWEAFSYKKGRNEAVMRWLQLGDLTDEQYQHIINAAKKEADRPLPPGQVRKMAQGWLNAQRWTDYRPSKKAEQNAQAVALNKLKGDLEHLKRLHAASQNPALLAEINKLDAAIAAAKEQP